MSLDKLGNRYEIQPDCLQTFNGIEDLHKNINKNFFDLKASDYELRKHVNKTFTREERRHLQMLKDAENFLEKSKLPKRTDDDIKDKIEENSLSKDIIISKQDYSIEPEKLRAIVLLQRLIKGRNEQNKMYEGREKRRDLI
mmetsp:Transcript_17381/g.38289  ORF Transcript_17381/g.38289 Transcript_17381/m.38289 type:complete len:141 (-) Transcript_17381:758-1180(-)